MAIDTFRFIPPLSSRIGLRHALSSSRTSWRYSLACLDCSSRSAQAKLRWSKALSWSTRMSVCEHSPTLPIMLSTFFWFKQNSPLSLESIPDMMCSKVVFPAPLCPNRQNISFFYSLRCSWFTASFSPYVLQIFFSSSAGSLLSSSRISIQSGFSCHAGLSFRLFTAVWFTSSSNGSSLSLLSFRYKHFFAKSISLHFLSSSGIISNSNI